ncbi:MAG: hypothetical protein KGI54_18730, partial [Pseudomonadota bacterium]|nr:hypothetical protein [Pseudomonadota bacterium]
MAGGIDWFRWHHGSVTDPKFQLIAKKTSVRVGDVLAVWAFVLEKASANLDRGSIGDIDFEALDLHLGIDDGTSERIFEAMKSRALILEDRVSKWEERQPKREREDTTAAERKRRQREREQEKNPPVDDGVNSNVTPCHTMSHHVTPRGEERREELTTNPNGLVVASPADDRHPCPHQEIIALYHEVLPMCPRVRDWTPARA